MWYNRYKQNSNSNDYNNYKNVTHLKDGSAGDKEVTLVVDEQNLVVVVCGRCLECIRCSGAVAERTATER